MSDPSSRPLQLPLALSDQPQSLPCSECIVFKACGGHELPLMRAFGCTRKLTNGQEVDPDDMNPLYDERFWHLWADVKGLEDFTVGPLKGTDSKSLPDYIPVLQHAGSRSRPPECDVIAIPLFDILRHRKGGAYGPRFADGSALRRRFRLRDSTRIILRGVDDDRKLERFWQYHNGHDVGSALSKLDLLGVTVPNFSFFNDATRFQILRNRKRIVLTCERLSTAGVNVIPHLNALTESDWEFWADFLMAHPEITVVCKEFQTGLKASETGLRAYRELVKLQEKIGRPLHPVLVAGGRFYREAQKDFPDRFTVLDSTAFMGALARQVLTDHGTRQKWQKMPTAPGEPIDVHFDQNVRGRKLNMEFGYAEPAPSSTAMVDVAGQMLFDGVVSKPYFTDQPWAPAISATHSGTNVESQLVRVIH